MIFLEKQPPINKDKEHQVRHYDAWLFWNVGSRCNLYCKYCFRNLDREAAKSAGTVIGRIRVFLAIVRKIVRADISQITKISVSRFIAGTSEPEIINIAALMKTLDKTGKIFRIGISGGGEPFLVPNLTEACAEITKKHYISINTNLTSDKIKKFADIIEPDRVLGICASLHIKELERLNLIDRYVSNFNILRDMGFRIIANEVAHPSLLREVAKYKEYFNKRGIDLSFIKFAGSYKGKGYPDSYTKEELEIFGLEKSADLALFHSRGRICNAGYNAAIARPNGDIELCYEISKGMGNIYKGIRFKPNLTKCPAKHCACPFRYHDPHLFEKALAENGYDVNKIY